jgi:hypothetical protein
MVWALLVLIAVVVAVHYWEYSRSVQEYTFAQPPGSDTDMRSVLAEKTPVIMELEKLPWRPAVAEKAPWSVEINSGSDGIAAVSVGAWLEQGAERPPMLNSTGLAEQMELTTGLSTLDDGRGWWWLPGFQDCAVDILPAKGWIGLTWITAERQWIGCSHGSPLKIWLAHSRYQPFMPATVKRGVRTDINPWTVTVAEAPWLGRVQYLEVIVHPGWCLGLPAHWGWAAMPTEEATDSWWWTASQHSPLSMMAAVLTAP